MSRMSISPTSPLRPNTERSPEDTGDGEEGAHKFVLESLLNERRVHEFVDLMCLKRKGWQEEKLDEHFQNQRMVADTAGPDLEHIWFMKMKHVLEEVNNATRFISHRGIVFLDLGCCPGGFTSHTLAFNGKATGVGVSLEVENGGHSSLLSAEELERFTLIYADLTYFQLAATTIQDDRLKDLPPCIKGQHFNLILLDAHFLRTQVDGMRWDYHRLQISQIIIALMTIAYNGTIVMKLSNPHRDFTVQLLYMLDVLSTSLRLYKPTSIHTNRGTFYAVAKGVGLPTQNDRLHTILRGFQDLWVNLTYGGEGGGGRFMKQGELDFIATMEFLIENYVDRLVQLSRGVWAVQAKALRGMLRKKGIVV